MTKEIALHTDKNYLRFLNSVIRRLRISQTRAAASAANNELIRFYWELGTDLIIKQKFFKWGSRILEQFSCDMQQVYPKVQGLSVNNLKHMRIFAKEYPDLKKSAPALHQLPWESIVVLLYQIKDKSQREWYAKQALANAWSRSDLKKQIETDHFKRQGISEHKITNYNEHLPSHQTHRASIINSCIEMSEFI